MSGISFDTNRLGGGGLIVAIGVWVLMLLVGIFFLWWGLAGPTAEPAPAPTATPTAGGLVPLTTGTPGGATPQSGVPPSTEVFGYGIAGDALPLPDYTMGQVESLGLGWVKQQVRWADFEPTAGQMDWSGYDAVIDAASQHGLKVMLSVVDSPDWSHTAYIDSNPQGAPPDDLTLFADFLGRMVDRYKGRIHAIEVWNEQNLDREWDTAEGVNAARYVEMLRMAYQVIKSRDPNIIVISGALSPTGSSATDPANPARVVYMDDFEYFQQMVANGFTDYCDCIGAHHNGINIPPDVDCDGSYQDPQATFRGYWDPPQPPSHSWCFKTTLWGYNNAAAGAKPLCVTEFGWASAEGLGGYPPGFEFAQDNTLQEQADYIVRAYGLMRQWGFVRLAFLWNLNYANTGPRVSTDPNAPYSIVDYNGVGRPAFEALKTMDKP